MFIPVSDLKHMRGLAAMQSLHCSMEFLSLKHDSDFQPVLNTERTYITKDEVFSLSVKNPSFSVLF